MTRNNQRQGTGTLSNGLNVYIVQQFIAVDPSQRGHWYECRRIEAKNWGEALKIAFPPNGDTPHGYRLVSA